MSKDYGYDAAKYQSDKHQEVTNKYIDDYLIPVFAVQSALATIIGVYAYQKQFEILKEQLALTERAVVIAEEYLALAKDNYYNISVPTWQRCRDLFDRYRNEFEDYENHYVAEAFRMKEYAPDYALEEGRAIGVVQSRFDRAAKHRLRQLGKYNRGRACSDMLLFAIGTALATVDAVNHGYRYEEAKKRALDEWYWRRQSDGIKLVDSMRGHVISGINNGANVATNGLNAVGGAVGRVQEGISMQAASMSNLADAYGGLANSMFQLAGYGMGRMAGSPFAFGGQAGMGGQHAFGSMSSGSMGGMVGNTPHGLPGFSPVSYTGLSGPQTGNAWAEDGFGQGINSGAGQN